MTVKKLTFCILCLTNAANLATEEDFNDENSSNSGVEENVLTNKNNWNTRKWGSIYFLVGNVGEYVYYKILQFRALKSTYSLSENLIVYILPFFISAGVKYQYFFHKNWGISIKLFFNNNISITEDYLNHSKYSTKIYHTIRISPSIECIYKKKLKHIFSCSFSFISINILTGKKLHDKNAKYSDLSFSLPICINFYPFQYEYNRCFLLKYGRLQTPFAVNLLKFSESISNIKIFWEVNKIQFFKNIIIDFLLNLEFELNIIGLNDLRKKKNK